MSYDYSLAQKYNKKNEMPNMVQKNVKTMFNI